MVATKSKLRRVVLASVLGLGAVFTGSAQAQIVVGGQVYGGGTVQPSQPVQIRPGLWRMDNQDTKYTLSGQSANHLNWLYQSNQPPRYIRTGVDQGGWVYFRQIKGVAITATGNGGTPPYVYVLDVGPEHAVYVGPGHGLLQNNVLFMN